MSTELQIHLPDGVNVSLETKEDGLVLRVHDTSMPLSWEDARVLADYIKSSYPPTYQILRSATEAWEK